MPALFSFNICEESADCKRQYTIKESIFMAEVNREEIDVTKRIVGGGRTVDGIEYIEYEDGTRATVMSSTDVSESVKGLSITVESDVSDAVKGFKALQREVRETTKALREYESESKRASGDE